ncbi:MAG TPA: hypoxanthine phosphoribosyltransferase [Nitriliruptorales bacterium]
MGVVDVRVAPAELEARIAEIGADLSRLYAGHDPLLITVLTGGSVFLADLVRAVTIRCTVDFLALGRYPGSGRKYVQKDLDVDIAGRHVVVVEDIVDTGLTLAYLLQVLAARQPASLRVCTLLDRAVRRIADLPLDWVGFEVGDEFLVGYGLDLDGRLRHVPAVLATHDPSALREDPEGTVRRALEAHVRGPDSG